MFKLDSVYPQLSLLGCKNKYTRTNTVFFPNPTSAIAPFSLLAVFEEDCKLGSKLLQGHKTGATRTVMHNVYCQYN